MQNGVRKAQGIVANGDESFRVDFYHAVDGSFDCLVEEGVYDGHNQYVLFFLSLK